MIATSGQDAFKKRRGKFYNGANAAFIVVDRTRLESLKNVEKWYDDMRKAVSGFIPVVLIGNKSDLTQELNVSHEDIKNEAKKHEFSHIVTSALTGENVNESFTYLVHRVLLMKAT